MMQRCIAVLTCIFAAGLLLEAKQDFERSYTLVPGRYITINNIMGDIHVTGYEGETIRVTAKSEGPESDAIQVIEKNFGPKVELFPICSKFKSNKTKVDFEVKVPKSEKNISLELKSGSGKIEVADIEGNLVLNSFRGDIKVENIRGNVYAHTISGKLNALVKLSKGKRWLKFASVSGNISVTAPSDFDARVQMSTNGTLKTDFQLDTRKNRYGGQTARGKLGTGTQSIDISSVFGSVSLLKKQ